MPGLGFIILIPALIVNDIFHAHSLKEADIVIDICEDSGHNKPLFR